MMPDRTSSGGAHRTADEDRTAILAWRRIHRQELLEMRSALSVRDHGAMSAAVLARLRSDFSGIRTGRIGIYWPRRQEVSLFPLATLVLNEGGSVSLPVVLDEGQPLQFRDWKPGDPLSMDVYEVPFPRDGPTLRLDTLMVPLVGFDEANYRLGYGGGSYDRTIAAAQPRPLTIGVGFEFMRMNTIEPLPDDAPMDFVVTEAGIFPRTGRTA